MDNSLKLADFYFHQKNILEKALNRFIEKTKFFPQIGIELEFYLLQKDSSNMQLKILDNHGLVIDFISLLSEHFLADLAIYKIEKEQGNSQIEIKISPHFDLLLLAQKIDKIKLDIQQIAQKNNLIACFDAQPFDEDCGSALQFNFSLHNQDKKNLLIENLQLKQYVIKGMLDSIDWAMIFYAPQEKDYQRFDENINRALHQKGKFTAPTNISFGQDNRTAAVRVPVIKNSQNSGARIEFRVAAADANCYLAMFCLLVEIERAINKKELPQDSQKVFGNAFDRQYSFKKIPSNLQIAQENFFQENILEKLKEFF